MPISYDLTQQDPRQHPDSTVKTTALTADLPQCGDRLWCQFGYECVGGDLCQLAGDQSTAPTQKSIPTHTVGGQGLYSPLWVASLSLSLSLSLFSAEAVVGLFVWGAVLIRLCVNRTGAGAIPTRSKSNPPAPKETFSDDSPTSPGDVLRIVVPVVVCVVE